MGHLPILLYPIFLGIFLTAFWYDIQTVPLVLSHIPFALASFDALSSKQWSTSLVLATTTGVSTWYHVNEYELHTIRHPSRRLFGSFFGVPLPWPSKKRGDYAKRSCDCIEYNSSSKFCNCSKQWTYWDNITRPSNTSEKAWRRPSKDLVDTVKISTRLDFTLALTTLHYMFWQMSLPLDFAFALALTGLALHVISRHVMLQGTAFTATVLSTALLLAIIRTRSAHTIVSAGLVAVALHLYNVGLTYQEDDHAARWAHSLWHIFAGWAASHAIRARMKQWKLPICKSPNAVTIARSHV